MLWYPSGVEIKRTKSVVLSTTEAEYVAVSVTDN